MKIMKRYKDRIYNTQKIDHQNYKGLWLDGKRSYLIIGVLTWAGFFSLLAYLVYLG